MINEFQNIELFSSSVKYAMSTVYKCCLTVWQSAISGRAMNLGVGFDTLASAGTERNLVGGSECKEVQHKYDLRLSGGVTNSLSSKHSF